MTRRNLLFLAGLVVGLLLVQIVAFYVVDGGHDHVTVDQGRCLLYETRDFWGHVTHVARFCR